MSIWYPTIRRREISPLVGITAFGALLAGVYGAVHDQVSYTISPEYFTLMKFRQFAWADLGLPERAFVAVIGFMASWWAGLIAGWLLARFGLAELWLARERRRVVTAIAILVLVAAATGALGALVGDAASGRLDDWGGWRRHVSDWSGFVVVACLHWGSYGGAILGTAAAVIYLRRVRRLGGAP